MKTVETVSFVHFAGLVLGLFALWLDPHSHEMQVIAWFMVAGNLTGCIYCFWISLRDERNELESILAKSVAKDLGVDTD